MNRVWISGRITNAAPAQGAERVFVIKTFEAKPKLILTKYYGDNELAVGDTVESIGELGEQEPVVVGGQVVKAKDDRVAMRNVYYAAVIYRLSFPSTDSAAEGKPPHESITASGASAKAVNVRQQPINKEVNHVRGPEVPWS